MSPLATTILMAVFFAFIVGFDIVLALDKRKENTYSERLRAWGKAWPPVRLLISFGFGLLCGHWWWT